MNRDKRKHRVCCGVLIQRDLFSHDFACDKSLSKSSGFLPGTHESNSKDATRGNSFLACLLKKVVNSQMNLLRYTHSLQEYNELL